MRDPEGTLELRDDHAARQLSAGSPAARFLKTPAAADLARSGRLVPFEFVSELELRSPRLDFVSHPYEWCDSQLAAAGRLTLDISHELLGAAHELKDASAWNIVFRGRTPMLCDHLSFAPIARREWWAFGQFVRHFIMPLAVSRLRRLPAYRAFHLDRDGLDVDTARALMGSARFLSRWWPLTIRLPERGRPDTRLPVTNISAFRTNLYRYCELNLSTRRDRRSSWLRYRDTRSHYSESAMRCKRETVARWLTALRPEFAVDLGCNTGEFAGIAASAGAKTVVAIDADHDAVDGLFADTDASDAIHPVIANLADVAGGRGWMGGEVPGLAERLHGRADVVMALAVTHHLVIGESIPLSRVASEVRAMTRRHAIVEFIDESDPMLVELAEQRQRSPADCSRARQRASFASSFDLLEEVSLPGTVRTLALMRRTERES